MARSPVFRSHTASPDARYPYLVIRLMPAVYMPKPLRRHATRAQVIALGWKTMDKWKRKHRVCIVFGPNDALYLDPDGHASENSAIPSGGLGVHGADEQPTSEPGGH